MFSFCIALSDWKSSSALYIYFIKKDTVCISFFELGRNGMAEFYWCLMKIMCNFSNAFYNFLATLWEV